MGRKQKGAWVGGHLTQDQCERVGGTSGDLPDRGQRAHSTGKERGINEDQETVWGGPGASRGPVVQGATADSWTGVDLRKGSASIPECRMAGRFRN